MSRATNRAGYDVKMRRTLIFWSVAFVLLILSFATTVVLLNASVYSASGFVRGYLDALARRDSAAAWEVPGVRTANIADTALLGDDALGTLDTIRFVSEEVSPAGTRTIVFEYTLNGDDSARTEFLVESAGTHFGLFLSWRFVASPLTTISISVLHERAFTVNELSTTSPHNQGESGSFVVFTPGRYTLGHSSTFLTATPITVDATRVGEIIEARIDVQANAGFIAKVQSDLEDFLDRCATQEVLMPTGCPFGLQLNNRIDSAPTWTIESYPTATIVPSDDPAVGTATWSVPATAGRAHINLDVRSLFDGAVSTLDRDVPFTVGYRVQIQPGNTIVLTPQAN